MRPFGTKRHTTLAAIASAVVLGMMATRATNDAGVAQRILSLRDAQLEIVRVRDHHVCSLHFRHRDIDASHGRVDPVCDTRIHCETTVYDGLARCADHQHIVDDEGPDLDGDGRVAIDLLAGTAVVDDDRFSF